MPRDEAPPFGRGETFFNGGTTDTTSGAQHEGKEWVFEDLQWTGTTGAKPARTNRKVRCKVVRNVSGIALLPKRLCKYKTTSGLYGAQVDGYCTLDAEDFAGVVDEWLPAAGVPANDLFWIVLEGPTLCLTDLAAAATNSYSAGTALISLTAATSQATTAGRVQPVNIANATTDNDFNTLNQAMNRIGRAMSARTTNQTNSDVLVSLREW